MGDRLESWGTPALIGWSEEYESSILTLKSLSASNNLIIVIICIEKFSIDFIESFFKV